MPRTSCSGPSCLTHRCSGRRGRRMTDSWGSSTRRSSPRWTSSTPFAGSMRPASLRKIADALGLGYQRVHQIVDVGADEGGLKECRGGCDVLVSAGRTGTMATSLIAGQGRSSVRVASTSRARPWRRAVSVGTREPARGAGSCRPEGTVQLLRQEAGPGERDGGRARSVSRRRVRERSGAARICTDCLALCACRRSLRSKGGRSRLQGLPRPRLQDGQTAPVMLALHAAEMHPTG